MTYRHQFRIAEFCYLLTIPSYTDPLNVILICHFSNLTWIYFSNFTIGVKQPISTNYHNSGPSEAGRLGRLKPPHFFTTFYNFIHYKHTCNHDSLNHARAFYNIKYMNPQSIILSIGGVAFLESIC